MREFGVGRQVQKFDGLRQQQQRRRREYEVVGQRNDGADRTGLSRLVSIVIGRWLRVDGFARRLRYGGDLRMIEVNLRQAGRDRRRGRDRVVMPERQRKLDREREQRQPRAVFDVIPEPLHDDRRLVPGAAKVSRPSQCNIITSAMVWGVNRARSGFRRYSKRVCDSRNGIPVELIIVG